MRTLKDEWLGWLEMHGYDEFKRAAEEFVRWYKHERALFSQLQNAYGGVCEWKF